MGYTITEESFASLISHWTDSRHNLNWGSIFVLPVWSQVWWQIFGSEAELYLRAVRRGENLPTLPAAIEGTVLKERWTGCECINGALAETTPG